MKKFFINKFVLTLLGVLVFISCWYIIYETTGKSNATFPAPKATFDQMFVYLQDRYTYICIWGSLYRMIIGFLIAAFLAIILGCFVGNHKKTKYVLNPTIIAIKAIPTAALIFLFLRLAGLKNAPIYVVAIIVFPIVYEATVSGFNQIDKDLINSSRVDGGNSFINTLMIKFPLAFPSIGIGLISSFALSLKIEIMAEVISGSSSDGIGRAIQNAYLNSENGLVPTFAYSLIAIIVILIISLLLFFIKKFYKKVSNVA